MADRNTIPGVDDVTTLIQDTLTAPPGGLVQADAGKKWIPAATATGAWAGKEDQVAIAQWDGAAIYWDFRAANGGEAFYILSLQDEWIWDPTTSKYGLSRGAFNGTRHQRTATVRRTGGAGTEVHQWLKEMAVDCPNNTSSDTAHSLDIDWTMPIAIEICWKNAVTMKEVMGSYVNLTAWFGGIVSGGVDDVNLRITTNYNATDVDCLVRIYYYKDSETP